MSDRHTTPLRFGPVTLPTPLLQAPMAGFSDAAFRQVLQDFGGVGLLTTEMIHARGTLEMLRRQRGPHPRLHGLVRKGRDLSTPGNSHSVPLAVQIWDHDAGALAEFAAFLTEEFAFHVLDLNFGCPAPDVVERAHSGSWLLQFPDRVGELASAVVRAGGGMPVTAKIRLGYRPESRNAPEVAQILESVGVAAITVHGRTTDQMYSGDADWSAIADVKRAVRRIPVVGNGDIRTARDAVDKLVRYGVDGVMIGRAALREPWLFAETEALLAGREFRVPSAACQKTLLLRHFELVRRQCPDREAVLQMRKVAPCYGSGLPNARRFRIAVGAAATVAEFLRVVEDFFPGEP